MTALSCLVERSISTPIETDPSRRLRVTGTLVNGVTLAGSRVRDHAVMLSRSEASRGPTRETLCCGSEPALNAREWGDMVRQFRLMRIGRNSLRPYRSPGRVRGPIMMIFYTFYS